MIATAIGASAPDFAWFRARFRPYISTTSPARRRLAARFDISLPAKQRKLEAAEQPAYIADHAGPSLIELAIAFVVSHPAVTSAISGPSTSSSSTASYPPPTSSWTIATIDRIDQIVRSGVNLNPAETSFGGQVLTPRMRRRRPG